MDDVVLTALAIKFSFGLAACAYGVITIRSASLRKRRIQSQGLIPDAREVTRRTVVTLLNLGLIGVMVATGALVSDYVSTERPTMSTFVCHALVLVVGVDLYEYLLHRAMHRSRWLWTRIHRIHHEIKAPLASDYLYVHPLEALSVGAGFAVVGALLVFLNGELSGWALWLWAVIRLSHALDSHSGIRSRWLVRVPFVAESEHHDRHHASRQNGNFGALTMVWDRLFGTLIIEEPAQVS